MDQRQQRRHLPDPAGRMREQAAGPSPAETAAAQCSACGSGYAPGMPFCEECGAALERPTTLSCPTCGSRNDAAARFCESCGHALHAPISPAPVEAAVQPAIQGAVQVATAPPEPPPAVTKLADDLALIEAIGSPAAPPEPAPLPRLMEADQLIVLTAQQNARFKDRKEEVGAILAAFERRRRELDPLSSGLAYSPSIRLWRCCFQGLYHFSERQCARPQDGGEWVMITEEDFNKMAWVTEAS